VIFVTVGTHEQPFDRLIREVDRLAGDATVGHDFFCQIGYGTYEPAVPHTAMVPYREMQERIAGAALVITHGGPGSVMPVLAARRPLVLVPRQHGFGEHVDDHQVGFCRRIGAERALPVVEDIATLGAAIVSALERGASTQTGGGAAPEQAVADLGRRIAALTSRRR